MIYDLNDRTPLAAIRNVGEVKSDVPRFGDMGSQGSSPRCEVEPVATQNGLWLVGNPNRKTTMVAGWAAFRDPAPIALRAIDAAPEVFEGRLAASDEVLGVEHRDGRIVRVGADKALDASAYGPSVRVWLEHVVGKDLIVYNTGTDNAAAYFRFDESGGFTSLSTRGALARFDGVRVASIERTTDATVVWTAPFTSDAKAEPTEVARIADGESVLDSLFFSDASLGDGMLALVNDVRNGPSPKRVMVLVDVAGATGVARRDLEQPLPLGTEVSLVGNDATHVYVTETTLEQSHLVRYSVPR